MQNDMGCFMKKGEPKMVVGPTSARKLDNWFVMKAELV
jgi:hypothetical protein